MKNDSFLSKPMDLPEENGLHNNDVNGEEVFKESSGYIEDIDEDAKQKDNVNTTALQWPLRHNNDSTEKISYGCNGFRRRKMPRCTYTGRISRIPSRYLSSDSESSDGSARNDVVPSRLKVKRRRKSSSNKLLVNGFKEHEDKFPLTPTDIRPDRIIYNLKEGEGERLANLECSEVFEEETSPISDDTISGIAHEEQPGRFFQVNNTLNEALKDREALLRVKLDDILDSKYDAMSELGLKKKAVCCLKATRGCVDISSENKRRPRFDSSMESTEQSLTEIACDKETSGELHREQSVGCNSRTDIANTCNEVYLNEESCDSSTKSTFVSSIQNSKQSKVSCASSADNDCEISFQKGNDGSTCVETSTLSSVNGCLSCNIVNGDEPCSHPAKIDLVKEDAVLSEACLAKKEILPDKQFVAEDKAKEQREEEDSGFKPAGLNCFRSYKMKRVYANKLNQKQKRRTVKANGNSGLKKQRLIGQLKQKSVDKVKKAVKLQKKINIKVNNKKDVQNVKLVKTSHASQELDRVLGMRRNPKGVYEFLVQYANGTSCWVSSDQIVANKHNCILREYLVENDQDVSVVNRIPFQAYCCDSLSLKECKPVVKTKKEKKKLLAKASPTIRRTSSGKQEVTVENDDNHCYITLNRETCKRKLTCVRIITDLVAALEDASVSDCQMVVIRGLGSKVFGGLTLESVCKASAEEMGNVILLKARYLVQTLSNFPKPLIALISKPAEGIGAVFVSLFDMICDEETWIKKQVIANIGKSTKHESLYSLPRVKGNSVPCEEILMGKKCENVQASRPTSLPAFPETLCNDSGNSTVLSTVKEIETTIHSLGKRPSLFGMNGEDVLKVNQASDCVYSPGCNAADDSMAEPEHESNTFLNDIPIQHTFTDSNFYQSSGSAPVDRYVKELESKILAEKQLVQRYLDEISNVWNDPSTILCNEES